MATTRARSGRTTFDRALLFVEVLAGIAVVVAIIGKSYGAAPTIFFGLAALAAAFSGWAIVRAVLAWRDPTLEVAGRVADTERERMEHEKRILLQGIKELEADFAIGKVDARDYDHLRRSAENRALAIIKRLKEQDAHWLDKARAFATSRLGEVGIALPVPEGSREVEVEIGKIALVTHDSEAAKNETADPRLFDNRPAAFVIEAAVLVCSACQTKADDDARFCVGCGRPRLSESAT